MGELVERSNTSVLKTEGGKPSVSSNLTLTSVSGRLLKWQREKTVNNITKQRSITPLSSYLMIGVLI